MSKYSMSELAEEIKNTLYTSEQIEEKCLEEFVIERIKSAIEDVLIKRGRGVRFDTGRFLRLHHHEHEYQKKQEYQKIFDEVIEMFDGENTGELKTGGELREDILHTLYSKEELEEMDRGQSPNEYTEVRDKVEREMMDVLYEDWKFPMRTGDGKSYFDFTPDILDAHLREPEYEDVYEKVVEKLREKGEDSS